MIRKITKSLLMTMLAVGIAGAKTYSDKTFLAPRSQLTNLPLQYATWHTKLHRKADSNYNGTIQAAFFYQESNNKSDMGKYFGYDWGTDRGIVNEIGVGPDPLTTVLKYPEDVIHNYNYGRGAGTLTANYKFEPYQTTYGVMLGYHQDLDKLLDGLFFRINAPVVRVKNDMNITSLITEVKQKLPEDGSFPDDDTEKKKYSFLDYLSGKIENFDANDRQEPLKYAKITGSSHSASGIADIEAILGYTLLDKKHFRAAISTGIVFPTGKRPKGVLLFEPVYGNGHHWGVEAGLDTVLKFFGKNEKSIEIMLVAKYKYIFEGTEKRTLDYIRRNGEKPSAGYYDLGGEIGQSKVFPLANILTQDLKVSPGSQFDGILNLGIRFKKFIFDLGYNLFAKEKENVSLKNAWKDNTYALAKWDYKTNTAFTADDAYNDNIINSDHLDFDTVTNPSQVTHKIYGSLGYDWDDFEYPVMLSVGGSYEMPEDNSALRNWSIWAKTGISW